MVSSRDQQLNPDLAGQALAAALISPDGTPNRSVTLRLQDGELDATAGRLRVLLQLLGADTDQLLVAGYFWSAEAPARAAFTGPPTRVCLREGTDWDWALWRARADEVVALYRRAHAWPNLLFSDRWVLESPPSSLDSYLYPAGPIE